MATETESGGASVVFGVIGGLVTACMLGGGAAFVVERRLEHRYREGWNLIPVVVVAADVEEDTLITFDQLSQRSLPEQFVTDSMVKPDSASYVVNVPIHRRARAGDPLRWGAFVDDRCAADFARRTRDVATQPAVAAELRRLNADVARQSHTFSPEH